MTQLNFEMDATAQKLTNWENEPKLCDLKGDLKASQPSHDEQVAKIIHWRDLLSITGEAKPHKVKGRSSVQPKLIRKQAEWRYAALSEPFLNTDRIFTVKPRTYEDAESARQNQLVLNYQFDTQINKQKFIDDFVRTTVDEGTCIVRLGWERETTTEAVAEPIFNYFPLIQGDPRGQVLNQAMQLQQQNPKGYEELDPAVKAAVAFTSQSGQPVITEQIGTQLVQREKVLVNRPTVYILDPQNVYIDPACLGDINKAQFVVYAFEVSKAELIKMGNYKNLDAIDWESVNITDDSLYTSTTPNDFNFKDKARRKAVAYEYWGYYDIHNNDSLVPIVATWIGDTLIRLEESPFPDGKLPFVVSTYLPVKRELYGEPDAELLEDNQKILGAVTRGMIDSLGRSANGQQGFAKGMLDPINKRKFLNGENYEFNPNMPPQSAYIEHQFPELPASALNMIQIQNQEAEALTGVKAFSGGLAGDAYADRSHISAEAVRGVLDASSKREMGILRRLARAIQEIGNRIIAMNAVFLSEQETIRITNSQFIEIRREDLKGNFDLIVDISTAEIDNAKAQDLSFMLQTIGPTIQDQTLVAQILADIADLKRMPDVAERLRKWEPQPDPNQQLQAQLLQAQVQLVTAQAQLAQANAQKAMAQAGKEDMDKQLKELEGQEKISNVEVDMQKAQAELQQAMQDIALKQAQANLQNAQAGRIQLETFEEQTGINHARALELQGAQARSNQNLEITKGLMRPRKEGESKPDVEAGIGFNALTDRMGALRQQGLYQ